MRLLFLLGVLAASPTTAPLLAKEPKLGKGELAKALPAGTTTAAFSLQLGARKDAVYVAVQVTDDQVTPGDRLSLRLHFPSAGATARGYAYEFGADGKRAPDREAGAPPFADALVKSEVTRTPEGFVLEAKLPLKALPRLPAKGPLALEACAVYQDQDAVGGKVQKVSSCESEMSAVRLPEDLRKGLKLKVPDAVEGLEARPDGWVGYSNLRFPLWAMSDAEPSSGTLSRLVTDDAVTAKAAELPVPESIRLHDGRLAYLVLSGQNPYASEGKCDSERELRLGLYVLEGRTAQRVLEWPAATCALGRALSLVIDDDASLTIGYSNGSTTHFAWSRDHFERTEFGKR